MFEVGEEKGRRSGADQRQVNGGAKDQELLPLVEAFAREITPPKGQPTTQQERAGVPPKREEQAVVSCGERRLGGEAERPPKKRPLQGEEGDAPAQK